MNVDNYQKHCKQYAIYPEAGTGSNNELYYLGLALAGEAGELAGKISKIYRDKVMNYQDLGKELGDVCWEVAMLATALGYDLSNIMGANLAKLSKRQEAGTLAGSGDNR